MPLLFSQPLWIRHHLYSNSRTDDFRHAQRMVLKVNETRQIMVIGLCSWNFSQGQGPLEIQFLHLSQCNLAILKLPNMHGIFLFIITIQVFLVATSWSKIFTLSSNKTEINLRFSLSEISQLGSVVSHGACTDNRCRSMGGYQEEIHHVQFMIGLQNDYEILLSISYIRKSLPPLMMNFLLWQ